MASTDDTAGAGADDRPAFSGALLGMSKPISDGADAEQATFTARAAMLVAANLPLWERRPTFLERQSELVSSSSSTL
jgi:hypothetical protein